MIIVVHRVAWLDPTPHTHDHDTLHAANSHARQLAGNPNNRSVVGPYAVTLWTDNDQEPAA